MPSELPMRLRGLPHRDPSSVGIPSPPSSTSSPITKGSSSLSSKVTSVLSTSYSDTEFRDALSLLDDRAVTNDPKTRRQIRLDLQKEVIDSNGEVISEFGRVAEQLNRIKATIDKLNHGYSDMRRRVLAAHEETAPALSEASSLFEKRQGVETKQQLLGAFKNHFVMSDDEIAALTLTAEPLDDRFFESLVKAKKISKDCEVLLGFENQTLGTELMEQTSKNINLGFQKLYKWVQREFKTLNLENPQMNSSIRKALCVLAERPTLFQNCLDFFAEARERILSDSFYLSLTGASSSSGAEDPSVKPIDLTAHDPLRYVGDMLAWIHSAAVSEHEALEVLFVAEGEELAKGLKSGRDAEVWRLLSEDGDDENTDFNAVKALSNLVDRDVSGSVRILRQRVEQVIQSNEEIIPAYKLANLINFYQVTFLKLLGPDSNLVECIGGLETDALRQFRALVRDQIATLQGEFQQPPTDSGVPGFLQDSLQQLEAIAKTYDSSLSVSADRENEFEAVMLEAFEPFISGCDNMAASIEMPEAAVFATNCRLAAANSLKPFDFTQSRVQKLQKEIDSQTQELIRHQYDFFRSQSGLVSILGDLDTRTNAHWDQDVLRQASQGLDDFLPSAMMDALERLKHLQDSVLARDLTEKAAEKFCQDFERLEKAVVELDEERGSTDDENGLRVVFPRTTAEIRVLLS